MGQKRGNGAVSLDLPQFTDALGQPETRISTVINGFSRLSSKWQMLGRTLDDTLLYFAVDGQYELKLPGRDWQTMPQGSLLALAPGVEHSVRLGRAPQLTLYHHRFDVQRQGKRLEHRPAIISLPQAWEIERYIAELYDEQETQQPLSPTRVRALLLLTYVGIFRLHEAARQPTGAGLSPQQRQALFAYVRAHLGSRPTPAELADHLGLSHDYFSRRFRATFGASPRSWLMQQRVRHAAYRLLESNTPIRVLAAELGYEEPFLFSRQFRQVMRQSPRDYRRQRQPPTEGR